MKAWRQLTSETSIQKQETEDQSRAATCQCHHHPRWQWWQHLCWPPLCLCPSNCNHQLNKFGCIFDGKHFLHIDWLNPAFPHCPPFYIISRFWSVNDFNLLSRLDHHHSSLYQCSCCTQCRCCCAYCRSHFAHSCGRGCRHYSGSHEPSRKCSLPVSSSDIVYS